MDLNLHCALRKAVIDGDAFLVEKFISMKADVNHSDNENETLLSIAISSPDPGSFEILKMLISAGADVNSPSFTKSGKTHLRLCCDHNFEEKCQLLIDAGARLNDADLYGFTALHKAAQNSRESICYLLLKAGADEQLTDQWGRKPVMLAKAFDDGWAEVFSEMVNSIRAKRAIDQLFSKQTPDR